MNHGRLLAVFCFLAAGLSAADPVLDDLVARYALARQLARERNDRELVRRIEQEGGAIRTLYGQDPVRADKRLRDLEREVGIDPGGWSMGGLAIFHPDPDYAAWLLEFQPRWKEALRSGDGQAITAAAIAWKERLGAQAGLPDMRRPGHRPQGEDIGSAEARCDLLFTELERQPALIRTLRQAAPRPGTPVRVYAEVAAALVEARPAVVRLRSEWVADLDRLVVGACTILIGLQCPDGHFPFPDMRGGNIRFGEMVDRLAADHPGAVKDGWVVVPVPDGGSLFDTGLAGQALLRSGTALERPAWIDAGLKAAGFCRVAPLSANFNYNAFGAGLVAEAAMMPGAPAGLLDDALRTVRLGILPGQVTVGPQRGRWLDAHNARTVYHLILVRGLHDVLAALPDGHAARSGIVASAELAMRHLLDEQDATGFQVAGLREMVRHSRLVPQPDQRLSKAIRACAAGIREGRIAGQVADLAVLPDLP